MDDSDTGLVDQPMRGTTFIGTNCVAPVAAALDRYQNNVSGFTDRRDLAADQGNGFIRVVGQRIDPNRAQSCQPMGRNTAAMRPKGKKKNAAPVPQRRQFLRAGLFPRPVLKSPAR